MWTLDCDADILAGTMKREHVLVSQAKVYVQAREYGCDLARNISLGEHSTLRARIVKIPLFLNTFSRLWYTLNMPQLASS